MTENTQAQHARRKDSDFFVFSETVNSQHAFGFWLKARDFNKFEQGRNDKKGNPLIKLFNNVDEGRFSREGIVCCLNGSEQQAKEMIEKHLDEAYNG